MMKREGAWGWLMTGPRGAIDGFRAGAAEHGRIESLTPPNYCPAMTIRRSRMSKVKSGGGRTTSVGGIDRRKRRDRTGLFMA